MRVGEAALRQLRRLSLQIESRVQHKEYNAGNLKLLSFDENDKVVWFFKTKPYAYWPLCRRNSVLFD
jgi:hypothetical protein